MTNPVETDFVEHDCDSGRKLESGGTREALGSPVQGALLGGRNRRLDGNLNQRLNSNKEGYK